MGSSKYNKLLGNKFITKYKSSLAFLSSSQKLSKTHYNYLQDSIIPTYHFQKSLTKLKIPKLEDTINRYLTALRPLLDESEFKKTEEITRKFEKNEAVELDREIRELDKADPQGNYISEPWFDMYLKARESIVLNYNPFIAFKEDPDPAQMNQAVRATNFLIAAARFRNCLRANKLKPEIFHLNPEKSDTVMFQRLMKMIPESVSFYGAYMFNAYPLDMSQYFRLFNSTRIPKKDKDVLFTDENKKHIFVIYRGNYYVFPVLDKENKILQPEEIYACIQHILNSSDKEPEFPLGVLTSENRDVWADVRSKLEALGNKEALNSIDSALFCMSLDENKSTEEDTLSNVFLHGDPKNRWFDKNHTLIVDRNGHAAVNFEHSWGDGVAVLRFFNELYDDTTKNKFVTPKTKPSFGKGSMNEFVKKLEFKIDDSIKAAIKEATVKYNKATGGLKLRNFENETYGRSLAKKCGLSPDSLMQSGIQVAFYNVYKKFAATYESASTSAFKYGRTETIRPVTQATNKLAQYMADKKTEAIDPNEMLRLMKECTKLHNVLVKEGAMGEGFDRHLFAMKYHAANRKKQTLPEFYNSHAYKFINHNTLSTSTLAYPTILTGGFAPVVPDGFGIGYRILDNSLGACISSYNGNDLKLFVDSLEETYERFHKLLNKAEKKDKKKD